MNNDGFTEINDESVISCDIGKGDAKKDRVDKIFSLTVASIILIAMITLIIIDLTTLEFSNDMRILGPGAFPLFIFVIITILDLVFMIGVITGKGGSSKLCAHIEWFKIRKALSLFMLIVICVFLMNYIGFVLSMMLFTFCEMKFLSEKKLTLRSIIISTILLPAIIYTIFTLLGVPLPSVEWLPLI